jgi:hypothetical protein
VAAATFDIKHQLLEEKATGTPMLLSNMLSTQTTTTDDENLMSDYFFPPLLLRTRSVVTELPVYTA